MGWKSCVWKRASSVRLLCFVFVLDFLNNFIQIILLWRNGKKYAGEVHFVHRNTNGSDFAVLAIFLNTISYEQNGTRNTTLRRKRNNDQRIDWIQFLETAATLKKFNQSTTLDLAIRNLIKSNLNSFWRYQGSLTIPSCDEAVTWTIFTEEIELDDMLLQDLRESVTPRNYRNPQTLNGRTVYRSYFNENHPSALDYKCCFESKADRVHFKRMFLSFLFFALTMLK